jgi:hypothetical protein
MYSEVAWNGNRRRFQIPLLKILLKLLIWLDEIESSLKLRRVKTSEVLNLQHLRFEDIKPRIY